MKLYLIWQNEREGYDTYDSAVVISESEEDARLIHPSINKKIDDIFWDEATKQWFEKVKFWNKDTKQYEESGEVRVYCDFEPDYATYGTHEWTAPYHVNVKYLGEAKEGSVRSIVCSSFNAG